jgi:Xaa-Pro aminopeptidase
MSSGSLLQTLDPPPFDTGRLDRIMEQKNLDILVVCSKHNVQYLLGGHRFFFFDYMDAIGVSRYLPIFVYPKGHPERAGYIGNPMEAYDQERDPLRVAASDLAAWGSVDAMQLAVAHIRRSGVPVARIGIESAFLPADAYAVLHAAFPDSELADALVALERLRARKTPQELEMLRNASEKVVGSMLAILAVHGPGATKRELVQALRREEVARDLTFEYCLIAMGSSFNRAQSDQAWQPGDVLSLDSGGNFRGYIGDLARMAILGEPDAELEDLLAEVNAIQLACRSVVRAGTIGSDLFAAVAPLLERSPLRRDLRFVVHGMGLISHEAPRLTSSGPVPYAADDAGLPLEPGMVLSIETTLLHSRRGFIKLEDTVAVTSTGCNAFGDSGRGWNRGGA